MDLALLGDLEEIRQLKYAYLRTLDLKQWDEFEQLFVPDVTGGYGGGLTFTGRDELVGWMREHLPAGVLTQHHCHHPEITVTGDDARGRWYLEDRVLVPEHHYVLEGAAFYDDRYVRTGAGWRIAHTGYERTYEASWTTSDLPSYRLTPGGG